MTGYNGVKMKEMKKSIEKKTGKLEERILCIGGDFNARIGNEGDRWEEEENGSKVRN